MEYRGTLYNNRIVTALLLFVSVLARSFYFPRLILHTVCGCWSLPRKALICNRKLSQTAETLRVMTIFLKSYRARDTIMTKNLCLKENFSYIKFTGSTSTSR